MLKTRLTYKKHPEDSKIWISSVIKLKRKHVNVIINWYDHTFEVIDAQGTTVFSGQKTGENYTALLRRIKRELIQLGAKIGKTKPKTKKR